MWPHFQMHLQSPSPPPFPIPFSKLNKVHRGYKKISSQVEDTDKCLPGQIQRQLSAACHECWQLGGQPAKTLISHVRWLHEEQGRTKGDEGINLYEMELLYFYCSQTRPFYLKHPSVFVRKLHTSPCSVSAVLLSTLSPFVLLNYKAKLLF